MVAIAAVAVVVALVVGLVALLRAPVFVIESVDVQGADHLTAEEVAHLAPVAQGATLLNVDADGIVAGLKRDAWVQDVTVNRIFPSTLQVLVTERKVGAIIEVPTGSTQFIQLWAIASDGMWLMPIPAQDSDVGKGISPELADQVRTVSAADKDSTLIKLDSGVEIAFGTAENIREKERICLEILSKNEGKVAYINVRVPERPTWRSAK